MPLSMNEIKARAAAFANDWRGASRRENEIGVRPRSRRRARVSVAFLSSPGFARRVSRRGGFIFLFFVFLRVVPLRRAYRERGEEVIFNLGVD